MSPRKPLGHPPHPRLLHPQPDPYGVQRDVLRPTPGGIREVVQGTPKIGVKGESEGEGGIGPHASKRRGPTNSPARGFDHEARAPATHTPTPPFHERHMAVPLQRARPP
ncbi:hypothetical protein SAMN04487983_100474 [Streptomyces sp. yr375]|nr:hypothetical protein SAMN04487983_100474 [Streptomyces sp. yr375]